MSIALDDEYEVPEDLLPNEGPNPASHPASSDEESVSSAELRAHFLLQNESAQQLNEESEPTPPMADERNSNSFPHKWMSQARCCSPGKFREEDSLSVATELQTLGATEAEDFQRFSTSTSYPSCSAYAMQQVCSIACSPCLVSCSLNCVGLSVQHLRNKLLWS